MKIGELYDREVELLFGWAYTPNSRAEEKLGEDGEPRRTNGAQLYWFNALLVALAAIAMDKLFSPASSNTWSVVGWVGVVIGAGAGLLAVMTMVLEAKHLHMS